jgi:hypothetical protein
MRESAAGISEGNAVLPAPTFKENNMAISSMMGGYYSPEYDQRFDSEAQYLRYKEAQYYESLRRAQMGVQQAGQTAVKPKKTEDDPLGFLSESKNKLLLTGEAS